MLTTVTTIHGGVMATGNEKLLNGAAKNQEALKVLLELGRLGHLTVAQADYIVRNPERVAALCRLLLEGEWDVNVQAVTRATLDIRFNWRLNSVGGPRDQVHFLQEKKVRNKISFADGLSMPMCSGKEVGSRGRVLYFSPEVSPEWMREELLLRGCRPASAFETIVTMYEVTESESACSFVAECCHGSKIMVTRDRNREKRDNVTCSLHVSLFKPPQKGEEQKLTRIAVVGIEI